MEEILLENIRSALLMMSDYAKECLINQEIGKCIAVEYCYNSIAIECDIDARLHLFRLKDTYDWGIKVMTSKDYYKVLAEI